MLNKGHGRKVSQTLENNLLPVSGKAITEEMNEKIITRTYNATTSQDGNHNWSVSIKIDGYTAISFSLLVGFSYVSIAHAEAFTQDNISGYCNNAGITITVIVVYIKN